MERLEGFNRGLLAFELNIHCNEGVTTLQLISFQEIGEEQLCDDDDDEQNEIISLLAFEMFFSCIFDSLNSS